MDVQVDFFQAHFEGRRQCGFCSNGRCHNVISTALRGGVPDPEAKAHPRCSRLLTLWLLSRRSSMVAGLRSPRREAEVPAKSGPSVLSKKTYSSFATYLSETSHYHLQTRRYKDKLASLQHTNVVAAHGHVMTSCGRETYHAWWATKHEDVFSRPRNTRPLQPDDGHCSGLSLHQVRYTTHHHAHPQASYDEVYHFCSGDLL